MLGLTTVLRAAAPHQRGPMLGLPTVLRAAAPHQRGTMHGVATGTAPPALRVPHQRVIVPAELTQRVMVVGGMTHRPVILAWDLPQTV